MNIAEQRKYDKSNLASITNPKTQIMAVLETVMVEPAVAEAVVKPSIPQPIAGVDAQSRLQDCEYELAQTVKESKRLRTALEIKTTENRQLRSYLHRQRLQIQQLLDTVQQKTLVKSNRTPQQVSLPFTSPKVANFSPAGNSAQPLPQHLLAESGSTDQMSRPLVAAASSRGGGAASELATVAVAKRLGAGLALREPEPQLSTEPLPHVSEPVLTATNLPSNPRIDLPQIPRS
jgi:hypothetical protein